MASSIFQCEIRTRFREAFDRGARLVDLEAGEIHRAVGGYPGLSHRMPLCCEVMRRLMDPEDQILHSPPRGNGASLRIRYFLPRRPR